jgi:hypothetical protein
MSHGTVSEIVPATCEQAFDLIHNYDRRLEWDTLLSQAYLTAGHARAGQGAVAVCVGRPWMGSLALTTEYVSFMPRRLAAVKMTKGPWLFATWAASLRHEAIDESQSRVTYAWQFTCRPRWARMLVEPLVNRVFFWETRKRLRALRTFLQSGHQSSAATS